MPVAEISLANLVEKNLNTPVLDFSPINETSGFEQSGIIGGDFLFKFKMTFDLSQMILRMKPQSSLVEVRPVKVPGGKALKQSLYIETSVIGAYLDNGEPFRRDLTIRWWEHEMQEYNPFISVLVTRELERLPEPHRSAYINLASDLKSLDIPDEAAILAEGYVARGIFHRKYIADALHVALASFYKMDFLVTWNFGHIASVHRQARVKLFNTAAGFFVPVIVTPEFLVNDLS